METGGAIEFSMKTIAAKIDVTKIDKNRLFQGKNGAKYLDVILIEKDGQDQYGNNFMVVQGVSKEEREQGIKGAILGNGKYMGKGGSKPEAAAAKQTETQSSEHDDVPF